MGARVDNYLHFLIQHQRGEHPCMWLELRGVDLSEGEIAYLEKMRLELRAMLMGPYARLIEEYLDLLRDEVELNRENRKLLDRNARLACDLHSHKLLLYRNAYTGTDGARVKEAVTAAKSVISSCV